MKKESVFTAFGNFLMLLMVILIKHIGNSQALFSTDSIILRAEFQINGNIQIQIM